MSPIIKSSNCSKLKIKHINAVSLEIRLKNVMKLSSNLQKKTLCIFSEVLHLSDSFCNSQNAFLHVSSHFQEHYLKDDNFNVQ